MRTPICLDESIVSLESAADAIALRAATYINIKPGRIGRAANAALAALPGFTLPGDISASGRFYARYITPPIELVGGFIEVPTAIGFGVEPIADVLDAVTTRVELVGA